MRSLMVAALVCAAPAAAQPAEMAAVTRSVESAAQAELADKEIPSIAVALIDRSGVVWSRAWGKADADGKVPATPATIYRAGSVSKLFTDIAVMRLVEQGKLDLDAPVTRYLPDFRPQNPFGGAITLRQLMTHRSGLVREAPRGHYFDSEAKGQADAVASLNATRLVAAPGAITKYSNAGIAVVGEVVARVTGKPYAQAVTDLVLRPLGMSASGFALGAVKGPVAYSQMNSFDGGRWAAPPLELGTPAAGSLYTDTADLGAFARAMLNGGGAVLKPSTLAEMWREQYGKTGTRSFGLGFGLGTLDGQRTVGHGGAVYGHVASLQMMPDAGIGVVVFATVDAGNAAQRIGVHALRNWLAAREGRALPSWQRSTAITGAEAIRLSGRFENGGDSVNLRVFDGRLVLDAPELAGELRRIGDRYVLDDAQLWREGVAVAPDASWVELDGRRFTRAQWRRPPPPNAELAGLIGEYGWDYNVLRVYERDGKPYVRVEWVDWLLLTRVAADHYAFPKDHGLYPLEALTFERDTAGNVVAAKLGDIRFPRRDFGAEGEAAIRKVMATGGIDTVREGARRATPPVETGKVTSDLVAVQSLDPAIRLDVRYAATNNFLGQQIYERPGAFLQRPAVQAMARINKALAPQGFGLLVHDAYRPWYVTKMFWDATPPASRIFVADPSQGSRHNRGAAVDLTMVDLATGSPMITTGRYDEMSSRSYTNYVGGSDEQRWLREVLRRAMEADGFTVYPQEWWHFDRDGWQQYPIGNRSFEELEK